MTKKFRLYTAASIVLFSACSYAVEFNETFALDFLASEGLQCQNVEARLPSDSYDDDGTLNTFDDACRGALALQLSPTLRLSENHTFASKIGFGVGNGLHETQLWPVSPWAADLEGDVRNINGRSRNHLLTAWYQYQYHTQGHALSFVAGLIDATDYIDANTFANDEFHQFMGDIFVNASIHNLPSYDYGVAASWAYLNWALQLVGMRVGENDAGREFDFWGTELGYTSENSVGTGHFRLLLAGTSKDFLNRDETSFRHHFSYGISWDQAIHDFGLFSRMTWQTKAVDYKGLYSFGLQAKGSLWTRPLDVAAIAIGYLDGAQNPFQSTRLIEAYYKLKLLECFQVSFDIQYQKDRQIIRDTNQKNPSGWVYSTRFTFEI